MADTQTYTDYSAITNSVTTLNSSSYSSTSSSTSSFGNIRFPNDLDTIDHWMDITVFEYSRSNRESNAQKKGIKGHITLPIPANLSTSYSQDYENQAMGLIQQAAMAATRVIAGNRNEDLGSLAERLQAETANQLKTATGLVAGYALDNIPGAEGVQYQLGMARNPHLAVLYKGPKFRTHSFSWTFTPRSREESYTLQKVIYNLKYSQAPDISSSFSNHLFKYPDEMEIKFHYPDFLFSIGPSVLTDIAINFHGDHPSYFQYTHAPVQTTVNLTFQETTIITKQTIANDGR